MITCFIIEDEPQAQKTLQLMLKEYFPDIVVLDCFDKVSVAAQAIKQLKPTFVFLDIELNGELGTSIAKHINREELDFEIIFTTAHSKYAIDAFSLSAIDYILKPINPDRFKEAVNRVLKRKNIDYEQLSILQNVATNHLSDKIALKNSDGTHIINTTEIIFLKAHNVYTEFYLTNNRKLVVARPLKEYEMLFETDGFFKTHRTFAINLNHLKTYSKTNLTLLLTDGHEIPLSRERKKDFESRTML